MRREDDRRGRTGGSRRRKSKKDEEVDRISGLPDSILLYILSFLPFRDAVRVSLILRPFRGLWRSLSRLYFEESDFHACRRGHSGAREGGLSNFVNHVLALHESPEIHTFLIQLDFPASDFTNPEFDGRGVMSSRLDEWISFAFKKKVKALYLDLYGGSERLSGSSYLYYRVPSAVLDSSSLVELELRTCNIESLGHIHLKSLQILWMFHVRLSDVVMRNLVSGSPSLKKVTMRDCCGIRVLKFDRHQSLTELTAYFCMDLEKVDLATSDVKILDIFIQYPLTEVICPNVVTLELYGDIDEVNLDCGSCLNNVTLCLCNLHVDHGVFKTLVDKLCNNANVSLGNWTVLVLSMWDLRMRITWDILDQPWSYYSGKSLTMSLNFSKWHLPGISHLLLIFQFLETLTIHIDPPHAQYNLGYTFSQYEFDGRSFWHSPEYQNHPFDCLAYHLKNVMVYGCVTEPYVIELIEFLLGKALVLEKLEISTERDFGTTEDELLRAAENIGPQKETTPEMLLDFSKKVFNLPRISPRAVVHVKV